MKARWAGFCTVAALMVAPAYAGQEARQTQPARSPTELVLNLRLTASSLLPPLSRRALMQEADAIWANGHVRLRWLAGTAAPDPAPTLRVLVAARAVGVQARDERWTIGELLRFGGSRAIAVASISGAQRVLAESRQFQWIDIPAMRDHRLGVVLGRAVAHEIGHYLLQTNSHAADGLMRANFDAEEFVALGISSFRLDPAAEAYFLTAASQGPAPRDSATSPSFSYFDNLQTSASLVIRPATTR